MILLNTIIKRWAYIYLLYLCVFFSSCIIGMFTFVDQLNKIDSQNINYLIIFINNLNVGFFILIGGLITGGTLTIFVILVNGLIVGNVVRVTIINGSINSLFTGLLPHFFFEIFGLVSFAVVGSFSGYIIIKFTTKKLHQVSYSQLFLDGLSLVIISIILLFIGALIEDFISKV